MARRSKVLILTSIFALVIGTTAFAAAKGKHRGHGAYEHGRAKLTLVVEGSKLTAQLEVPSESIYGFEYQPESDNDKKQRETGVEKLKNNFEKMLLLDKSLGCTFQNTKIDLAAGEKGDHSETHAEFVVTCQKPLVETKVSFAFGKVFPRIKEVKVQVISDTQQSGADIDNDMGEVTF